MVVDVEDIALVVSELMMMVKDLLPVVLNADELFRYQVKK